MLHTSLRRRITKEVPTNHDSNSADTTPAPDRILKQAGCPFHSAGSRDMQIGHNRRADNVLNS
jgi:hypothetical protein